MPQEASERWYRGSDRIVMWVVMPERQPKRVNSLWQNPSATLGLILVVVGVLVLAGNLGLIHWNLIWPAALIALGVLLLVRSAAKRS